MCIQNLNLLKKTLLLDLKLKLESDVNTNEESGQMTRKPGDLNSTLGTRNPTLSQNGFGGTYVYIIYIYIYILS